MSICVLASLLCRKRARNVSLSTCIPISFISRNWLIMRRFYNGSRKRASALEEFGNYYLFPSSSISLKFYEGLFSVSFAASRKMEKTGQPAKLLRRPRGNQIIDIREAMRAHNVYMTKCEPSTGGWLILVLLPDFGGHPLQRQTQARLATKGNYPTKYSQVHYKRGVGRVRPRPLAASRALYLLPLAPSFLSHR